MSLFNEPTSVDQSDATSSVKNRDLAHVDQCFFDISILLAKIVCRDHEAYEALQAWHLVSSYLKTNLENSAININTERLSDPSVHLGDKRGIIHNAISIKQAASTRSPEIDGNAVPPDTTSEAPRQRAPSSIKKLILPTRLHVRSSSDSSSNTYKRSPGSRPAISPPHARRIRRGSSARKFAFCASLHFSDGI